MVVAPSMSVGFFGSIVKIDLEVASKGESNNFCTLKCIFILLLCGRNTSDYLHQRQFSTGVCDLQLTTYTHSDHSLQSQMCVLTGGQREPTTLRYAPVNHLAGQVQVLQKFKDQPLMAFDSQQRDLQQNRNPIN